MPTTTHSLLVQALGCGHGRLQRVQRQGQRRASVPVLNRHGGGAGGNAARRVALKRGEVVRTAGVGKEKYGRSERGGRGGFGTSVG
mgnify:CR=1 FL=1